MEPTRVVSDYILPSDKTLFPCFLHPQLPSNPIYHQLSRRECFWLLVSLIFVHIQITEITVNIMYRCRMRVPIKF